VKKQNHGGQMKTFGDVIAEARKQSQLTQRQLAGRIKNGEGRAISGPYLNDIEHDQRHPPRGFLLWQFAQVLKLEPDLLYFYARELPADIDWDRVPLELAIKGFRALRRTIDGATRNGLETTQDSKGDR
jgi:transcriptional regulator with XRE-family HTH domain